MYVFIRHRWVQGHKPFQRIKDVYMTLSRDGQEVFGTATNGQYNEVVDYISHAWPDQLASILAEYKEWVWEEEQKELKDVD